MWNQLKNNTIRVGYIPVHVTLSMPTVDDTENLSTNLVFLETTLSQHLLIPRSIFDDWGHMRTLCSYTGHSWRNEPIAFLVNNTSSRVVLDSILVARDPCDNSETSVRARSLVTRLLTQTAFWHRIPLMTLENGPIRCLRRVSSPHVSESVKNWSLWTEKRPWPWW